MFQTNNKLCIGIKVYETRKRWITTFNKNGINEGNLYYITNFDEQTNDGGINNENATLTTQVTPKDDFATYYTEAKKEYIEPELNYNEAEQWEYTYSNYHIFNAMTRTYLLGESINFDDFYIVKIMTNPITENLSSDNPKTIINDIKKESIVITPQVFTTEGIQDVTFSYTENNITYSETIQVKVLPYKLFENANWDEVYETCCARQNNKMEERYVGDVWQRFVTYGQKKIVQLPGDIPATKQNVKSSSSADGGSIYDIGESNTRVFPLYQRGFCEVAVIGIETDGLDEASWGMREDEYNPIAKGTITFQVCDLENTIESFAQSSRLANFINAWSSKEGWNSQLLLIKYCYLFYNLLDEKMKSYIHAPGFGFELNTKSKQLNEIENHEAYYKRQDLKTGYMANIDAVLNLMNRYDCMMAQTAWIRSSTGVTGKKHQICQLYDENSSVKPFDNKDRKVYTKKVVIDTQEKWNANHQTTVTKNVPFGFAYENKKYNLATSIFGEAQNNQWGIIENEFKDDDGNKQYLISGLSTNAKFLVLDEIVYGPDNTDKDITSSYDDANTIYKKILKLPDNFPTLTYNNTGDEEGWVAEEEEVTVYIKEMMYEFAQLLTIFPSDILNNYTLITDENSKNIYGATLNNTNATYRVHMSQMKGASVSVYPFLLALKQKLLNVDDELYKSQYWPITPVFIPSAAEFGIHSWVTTNSDNSIKTISAEEGLESKLGKFVYHWDTEDIEGFASYLPQFKYDPNIYTWKTGNNAPKHWLWTRDVIKSPEPTVKDLPYIQLKLNLDIKNYNPGTGIIYAADERIQSKKQNNAADDLTNPGNNTKAYIAPAFTIRPARNMHPKDDRTIYEAIQF